jgi:catechol 2,3-dioxygenase-like lactoylglutathione lyase family enzyme
MPAMNGVKETCLHVDELRRSRRFYEAVMGLSPVAEDERFCAYDAGAQTMLLLFERGGSLEAKVLPGGVIPPHGGSGHNHVGFAISRAALGEWEAHLGACGVEIESRMEWPRGGRSVYFRDPDGHLLELLTPGVWANY